MEEPIVNARFSVDDVMYHQQVSTREGHTHTYVYEGDGYDCGDSPFFSLSGNIDTELLIEICRVLRRKMWWAEKCGMEKARMQTLIALGVRFHHDREIEGDVLYIDR